MLVRRITNDEFLSRMEKINSSIEIKGEYVTSRLKIDCRCKVCGTEWKASGNALLSGTGCPHCAAVKKCLKTQEEFEKELFDISPFIKVLSEYNGGKNHIKCCCTSCNKTFETKPQDLLNGHLGHRCPVHHESRNKDPEQFQNELESVNSDIILLEKYVSTDKKIFCKCKKCEHKWNGNPSDLLNGHGCPCCNASRGEKMIHAYAKKHNIEYVPQYSPSECKYKYKLRFDVYFPQQQIIVEYDGRQHFEPIERWGGEESFRYVQIRDEIKNQYCLENNIKMVRIPYWEYNNIDNILDTHFT